jgi:hypothetical protein
MISIRHGFAGLAVGLVVAGQAMAARPPAPAVQAVIDCRKIVDGAQRLACYDHAADALTSAQTSGDLVTLDRQQRQTVRRQAFGFQLPSLAMLSGAGEGELSHVEDTIAAAWQAPDGRWMFRMQDGAVWRQTDEYMLYREPHAGSTAVIKRAALGGYMMNVDGQPEVRVHRDN